MTNIKDQLLARYLNVRNASCEMCAPLTNEQCRIQPIPEVSPPWWNLAHTSWFFVRNVIKPFRAPEVKEDNLFDYILNSYYATFGPRLERGRRGLMTRPTMEEVYLYRQSVDQRIVDLIEKSNQLNSAQSKKLFEILQIGMEHERQHQELFYSEIKYILYQNPLELREAYHNITENSFNPEIYTSKEPVFVSIMGEMAEFGNIENHFGWDNEYPIHKYFLNDFSLSQKLVTNGEYLEFIDNGGYQKQILWLDNGWNKIQAENWQAPLYWEKIDNEWYIWTLRGMQKLNLNEPVCHISFYEAEAYAQMKKARLPSEREWEYCARLMASNNKPNFIDSKQLHPLPLKHSVTVTPGKEITHLVRLEQLLGDVWEWTNSYYEPYPGYKPFKGDLKEYNQKFMDNQRVLRGGSCVSEPDHIRISYRNFWPADTRFQFSGLRLAID